MSVPIKKLITERITGEWGSPSSEGNGVKVLRTTNFTNEGVIDYSEVVIRDIDKSKIERKKLKAGDIIIEKSGGSPTQPVGRVVFFEGSDETFLSNNFTAALRPDSIKVFPKFLFYILFNAHKRGLTLKHQNRTTGIINLRLDDYLSQKINLPSNYSDQIRIATVLEKAEKLIRQRKESIKLLDKLLRDTFLSMFGDPVRNERGWEEKKIGSILKIKHGFAFKSEFFSNEGDLVLLTPGNFHETGGYLDREEKQKYYTGEFSKDYLLRKGDVLVAMTEQAVGLLGSTLVVPQDNQFLHNQRLGLLQFVPSELNNIYIARAFNTPWIRGLIAKGSTGLKVKHTSPQKIEAIKTGIPPIELQNAFASIVEKVDTLKEKYIASLADLENLYGSLSQRAFKEDGLDLSRMEGDDKVLEIELQKSVDLVMHFSDQILQDSKLTSLHKSVEGIQMAMKTSKFESLSKLNNILKEHSFPSVSALGQISAAIAKTSHTGVHTALQRQMDLLSKVVLPESPLLRAVELASKQSTTLKGISQSLDFISKSKGSSSKTKATDRSNVVERTGFKREPIIGFEKKSTDDAKTSKWETVRVIGKGTNVHFETVEGDVVLKKVFSKKKEGFTFQDFEDFLKKESFKYEYDQLKEFFLEKLEAKELVQYYASEDWIRTNVDETESKKHGFVGQAEIRFLFAKRPK